MSIADLRRCYEKSILLESSLASTPFVQFNRWFDDALASGITDPSAMTLATAGKDGRPSARIVLLKAVDEHGFVFFTNYESRKARNISENPYGSLSFYWSALERQVHIEGAIEKTSLFESDRYHESRPLDSRIGAWASPQSQPISRQELDARMASLTESLGDHPVRPPFWGGYRLVPQRIEFWQGRASRLHDRFVYRLDEHQQWQWCRLAP